MDNAERKQMWQELEFDAGWRELQREYTAKIEALHGVLEQVTPGDDVALTRVQQKIADYREFIGAAKAHLNTKGDK